MYQKSMKNFCKVKFILHENTKANETLFFTQIFSIVLFSFSLGNILIKFVDVSGRFVEIENTGNQSRDLTGWYIERTVDGHRIEYKFPVYQLGPHTTVRVYGNYRRRSSSNTDDHHLQLIASNFYDWGNGRQMRTELFNRDDVGKALFEQTIKD